MGIHGDGSFNCVGFQVGFSLMCKHILCFCESTGTNLLKHEDDMSNVKHSVSTLKETRYFC
jgi:hypothetical protein